jgi:GxxExxY protein
MSSLERLLELVLKFIELLAQVYWSPHIRSVWRESLRFQGIAYRYEWPLPIEYKGVRIAGGYRMDLLVEGRVIVEVKAVNVLAPIHDAQLLTYMRLRGVGLGLLMNFNEVVLKDGIRRKILDV